MYSFKRARSKMLLASVSILVIATGSELAQETEKQDPRYQGRMKRQTRGEEQNARGWAPPSGDSPVFTTDWVSERTDGWMRHLGHLEGQANVSGIEIGSFEGRSAIWFLENILTGEGATMTCLDLFGERLDLFFDHNIRVSGLENRVHKMKGSSQELLREFSAEETFDFIYVDGCHLANCALADMVLSWDLLKRDGIMIVDDYGLAGPPLSRPKPAVDAFIEIYAPNLEVIERDYQVVFRKTQAGY